MIFASKTEVESSEGGVVVSIFDRPDWQPRERVDLAEADADQLVRQLVRQVYPGQTADEILALLP